MLLYETLTKKPFPVLSSCPQCVPQASSDRTVPVRVFAERDRHVIMWRAGVCVCLATMVPSVRDVSTGWQRRRSHNLIHTLFSYRDRKVSTSVLFNNRKAIRVCILQTYCIVCACMNMNICWQRWLFDERQVFPGCHCRDGLFNAFLLHLCGLLPALGSSMWGPSCPLQPQQESTEHCRAAARQPDSLPPVMK